MLPLWLLLLSLKLVNAVSEFLKCHIFTCTRQTFLSTKCLLFNFTTQNLSVSKEYIYKAFRGQMSLWELKYHHCAIVLFALMTLHFSYIFKKLFVVIFWNIIWLKCCFKTHTACFCIPLSVLASVCWAVLFLIVAVWLNTLSIYIYMILPFWNELSFI